MSLDGHKNLFPPIEPFSTGELRLESPHTLYWEQSGNPEGLPVLFLHGGPGAGVNDQNRRFFNPRFYRIILYDQRGAGRSKPLGDLTNNTTTHLIGDIEFLRCALGVEKWVLFGGSWGSTLALAYAEMYPERCIALILRGIFLCRKSEIEWFMYGIRTVFPKNWGLFEGYLPADERHDLLTNYYRRLVDPDPDVHMPAALAWAQYEGSCSTFRADNESLAQFQKPELALSLARLEAHYFVHNIFLSEGALLRGIDRIRSIPGRIVQGRYDMICPVVSAIDLHVAWPEAKLTIVADAGHSSLEPGICSALVHATEQIWALSNHGG